MFIDSKENWDSLLNIVAGKPITAIPLLSSNSVHPIQSSILSLYVYCDGAEYVIPYKHPESLYKELELERLFTTTSYVHNISAFLYNKVSDKLQDITLAHYLNNKEGLEVEMPTEQFYTRLHSKYSKPGTLISISSFVKYCRDLLNHLEPTTQGLDFYSRLQRHLHTIESSGLAVDRDLFIAHYGTPVNLIDKFVYTKYNLFTTTGRPSNRFGGVNFAALNKQDDTRKCFLSRFSDGQLVEVDFKAYHPHIIASLVDYDFGQEDVYHHLACSYFDTLKPTSQQVTKAKEYTFNQVYGGIDKKYLNIEFFKRTKEFTTNLYKLYKQQGYVESAISGRRFSIDEEDLSETRLFNYIIQMTETELNCLYLDRLLPSVGDMALPILYTYDAVVFDCKKEYIKELVKKLFDSTTNNFPISVKIGDNYKEMSPYI